MHGKESKWWRLAAGPDQGDRADGAGLGRAVGRHMARLVRREIGAGTGTSALAQRIRATADQVSQDCDQGRDREKLVDQVADEMCDWLKSRLRPVRSRGQKMIETIPV
jgi:hypothetical protein